MRTIASGLRNKSGDAEEVKALLAAANRLEDVADRLDKPVGGKDPIAAALAKDQP